MRIKSSSRDGAGQVGIGLLLLLVTGVLIVLLANEMIGFGELGRGVDMPAIAFDRAIGATVEGLDAETALSLGIAPKSSGLVVTSVSSDGPAARAGVRPGDVIEQIGTTPVRSVDDAAKALATLSGSAPLKLHRHRDYAIVQVRVRRPSGPKPARNE